MTKPDLASLEKTIESAFEAREGVSPATRGEVRDAVTTTTRGIACLVIRLGDGTSTSIPVGLLAIDREQFVREMQRHLGEGQRITPL